MTTTQTNLLIAAEAARLTALQTVRDRMAANAAAVRPSAQLQGGDLAAPVRS